jgi:Na+/H+-dicarboxylate symporter
VQLAHKIGLSLSLTHSIVFLVVAFLPLFEWGAGIAGTSIYLPLAVFNWLGLPVFGGSNDWGWSSPSGIGYALVIGFWIGVWFLIGRIIEPIFNRERNA